MRKGIMIHEFDFGKLIAFAEEAEGEVYIKTAEGDVLNMKSKLTQLLALSGSIDWGKIGEAEIVCENLEDEAKLFRLNLFGHEGK